MNKRGQIYLAAAVIIILVIFGLVAVSNYAKPKDETVIYDLKKELNLETGQVIDSAIYNRENTHEMIVNWTDRYVQGMEGKEVGNWVFVYGDSSNVTVITIKNESAGTISLIGLGGTNIQTIIPENKREAKNYKDINSVNVSIGGYDYNFQLREGQNFMFLIKKEGYIEESEK